MMSMIVVTGTPGTGKTETAKLLAKALDLPFIEVNKFVKAKKLFTGKERGSLVVDLAKLKKALTGFDGVVEGHVLCEISLPATCIVLRSSPPTIERRLKPRHYSGQKLRDNLEAEALDYCFIKARQNYKTVFQVNTTRRTPASAVRKILTLLSGKAKSDSVDWSNWLLKSL